MTGGCLRKKEWKNERKTTGGWRDGWLRERKKNERMNLRVGGCMGKKG